VLGWRELAADTQKLTEARGAKSVLADARETTAELIYYLRDTRLPVVIWYRGGAPQNHFEMTRPLTTATPEPLLYVTLNKGASPVPKRFKTAEKLPQPDLAPFAPREVRFYLLGGYEQHDDD
jgi:hypothetical protein